MNDNITVCGIPSNMSVANCKRPIELEYGDTYQFQNPYITPSNETGYHYYNPQIFKGNLGKYFTPTKGPEGCYYGQYKCCTDPNWESNDPRLKSMGHNNEAITLDMPPFDGGQTLINDIAHDKTLNGYGQNYKTYTDINSGDILYYNDISLQNPYFSPNFSSEKAIVTPYLYRDPMGSVRPRYNREPLLKPDCVGTKRNSYNGCLSFLEDTNNHRQDIMAHQMIRRNEQRWEPRWQIDQNKIN